MSDLTLTPTWTPGVFRLESTTPILAHDPANGALPFGADGPSNKPAKDVGCRTEWLRQRVEKLLVHAVTHGTTHDLTAAAEAYAGVRVVAGEDYSGVGATTVVLPAGQFLIINECRWPLAIRGPSGVTRNIAARTSPNATAARVHVDEIDTSILAVNTPPMRDVEITSVSPPTADSAGVTSMTISGKGFLGAIDVQVNVASIAFVVVSDTVIAVSVDGPAIGAGPGPGSVQIFRTGGENAIASPAFTFT